MLSAIFNRAYLKRKKKKKVVRLPPAGRTPFFFFFKKKDFVILCTIPLVLNVNKKSIFSIFLEVRGVPDPGSDGTCALGGDGRRFPPLGVAAFVIHACSVLFFANLLCT